MKKTILIIAFFALAGCTNPSQGNRVEQPISPIKTINGVTTNEETMLISGLDLNSDEIFLNEGYFENGDVLFEDGLSGNAFKSNVDANSLGSFITIDDGTIPEMLEEGSVEVWIKPEASNEYVGILHKGQELNFSDEAWSLQFHNNLKIGFYYKRENGPHGVYDATAIELDYELIPDEWYHLAVTWKLNGDGSILTILYVNGIEKARLLDTADLGPIYDTDGAIVIGSQIDGAWDQAPAYGNFSFNGLIDEIFLYEIVRTPEEILNDYHVYK